MSSRNKSNSSGKSGARSNASRPGKTFKSSSNSAPRGGYKKSDRNESSGKSFRKSGDSFAERSSRPRKTFKSDSAPRGGYKKSDRSESSGKSFRKSGDSFEERSSRPRKTFKSDGAPRGGYTKSDRGESSGKSFRKSGDSFEERSSRPRKTFKSDGAPRGGYTKSDRGESSGKSFRKSNDSFEERSSRPRKTFKSDSAPRGGYTKSDRGESSGRPFRKSNEEFGEGRSRSGSAFSKPGKKFFKSADKSSDARREDNDAPRKSFSARAGGKTSSDKPRREAPFKKRFSDESNERPFKKAGARRSFDEADEKPRGFTSKRKVSGERKSFNEEEEQTPAQTSKVRLNRYIANSGVCSRREADELISMGLISVNGKTITELGYKVNPGDEVRYESKVLRAEKPVYILLNKPKGYLTTTVDPQERNTVMHLIGNKIKERIYPVGRLDRNTTGLLLLTNDGDLADKLMHPSYNVKKIYKVELDRPLTKADFQKIAEGIDLEEGKAMVDDIAIISDDGRTVGVEIHIGWNRVVRRLFESLEYQVVKLDRSVYAGLDKKDLGRGEWRFLKKEEIVRLKHYK